MKGNDTTLYSLALQGNFKYCAAHPEPQMQLFWYKMLWNSNLYSGECSASGPGGHLPAGITAQLSWDTASASQAGLVWCLHSRRGDRPLVLSVSAFMLYKKACHELDSTKHGEMYLMSSLADGISWKNPTLLSSAYCWHQQEEPQMQRHWTC